MSDQQSIMHKGGNEKIGRQIVLPISKAVEIAWKSIRIRIWRSLITTSGIVLAIAFLMSIWGGGAITGALRKVSDDDPLYLTVQRALQKEAIAQESVSIHVGILGGEVRGSGTGANTPDVLIRDEMQARPEFSPRLLSQQVEALVGELNPAEDSDTDRLDAVILSSLSEELSSPRATEALRAFVEDGGILVVLGYGELWPADIPEQTRTQFNKLLPAVPKIENVQVTSKNIKPSEHSAMGDVEWETHPEVAYLTCRPATGAIRLARAGGETILWAKAHGEGQTILLPLDGALASEPEMLSWLLKGRLLTNLLRWGSRDKFEGGAAAKRNLWLVCLSLLVCIVGITNAMLMSVTERFREIGTMKCLGALDRFVVRLFLIESSFQGAAGSVAGAVIGLLLAFLRALFTYHVENPTTGEKHWLALRYFPVGPMALWFLIAVGVGVVLSVLAAIYPAYRAARMEPVEAMRSEA